MKRNALAALLLLLLGAALSGWLSTRDAHAQAFPPASSGGTSYTHPSAISLPNGIDSQDGGTFRGTLSSVGAFTNYGTAVFATDGGASQPVSIQNDSSNFNLYLSSPAGSITAISFDGIGTLQYSNFGVFALNAGMQFSGALTGITDVTATGKFQSSAASGQTAFAATTAGARWYIGPTRYLFDDGAQINTTAAIQAGSYKLDAAMSLADDGNQSLKLTSFKPDTATSKGLYFDTFYAYSNASSALLTLANSSATKAKVDYNGQVFGALGSANAAAVYAGGTLSVNTTTVGNVGAGEDDLITYSLPADSLVVSGRGVRITAWGTTANNAHAKTLKVYFGGTALISHSLPNNTLSWRFEVLVFRTGASAQAYNATLIHDGSSTQTEVKGGTLAVTETAAITIKTTGEATADNDITSNGLFVEAL